MFVEFMKDEYIDRKTITAPLIKTLKNMSFKMQNGNSMVI